MSGRNGRGGVTTAPRFTAEKGVSAPPDFSEEPEDVNAQEPAHIGGDLEGQQSLLSQSSMSDAGSLERLVQLDPKPPEPPVQPPTVAADLKCTIEELAIVMGSALAGADLNELAASLHNTFCCLPELAQNGNRPIAVHIVAKPATLKLAINLLRRLCR